MMTEKYKNMTASMACTQIDFYYSITRDDIVQANRLGQGQGHHLIITGINKQGQDIWHYFCSLLSSIQSTNTSVKNLP